MTTYYPKLLQPVEITASNNTLGYNLGGATTKDIVVATYPTVIEVLANLDTQLGGTFVVAVDYRGIVTITNTAAWTVTWGTTDAGLQALLGFTGAETVQHVGADYILTATKRHLYGWYAPVPVEYPGIRRMLPRRVQRTDAAGASMIASSSTHREIDLLFDACLEPQLEPTEATTADDGYGGTIDWTDRTFVDWWEDVAAKEWRYYEEADDGTVAAPGTEGVEYLVCVRLGTDFIQEQVDGSGYTYFAVRFTAAVV